LVQIEQKHRLLILNGTLSTAVLGIHPDTIDIVLFAYIVFIK